MDQPQPSSAGSTLDLERQYGDEWAQRYDSIFPDVDDAALDFLEARSGSTRRVLELAVGTGRVAIPLAQRGVEVTGVDLSEAMLSRLRSKPDAHRVTVVLGDMAEVPVPGVFPMIFVAFNSFFAISTQARQIECFQNVAVHLEPGGRFVLECFVPDLKRFDANHRHESERTLEPNGRIHSEVSIHHPETQQVDSEIFSHNPDGSKESLPVSIRYAWPSELDLMAELAGLSLDSRHQWYDETPFTKDSGRHVSAYRKT